MRVQLTHDPEADAIYIQLRAVPYAFGRNLDYERRIDYGADEQPRGIELLGVSHGVNLDGLPQRAELALLLEKHDVKVFA